VPLLFDRSSSRTGAGMGVASFLVPDALDVLDVLVVAYLFYRLILIIRGTAAAQMVAGLVAILVASAIAQLMDLKALSWLVGGVRVAWVVAAAILFQPELRKALALVGENRLFRPIFRPATGQSIDELVEAARKLAMAGYGAIVVVERTVGLMDIVATGRRVMGNVSADLLVSILTPPGPLHDGAVVVRGDKVVGAGCVLPLSTNPKLAASVGLRHRAALGITEQTDAVAIVVSEETKAVSLAWGGRFARSLDSETLHQRLSEALSSQE
jgi:diadenylate cyclase